jgi:hypothetical protein
MRWIIGGPDLPPELLQALEDGKLVFFCGAGVSYPAGLPTFQGLVEKVYKRLGQPLEGVERLEFDKQNYDRVFGLLEKRLVKASLVRRAVIEILHLDPVADLPSHEALLTLATTRDGTCRLVTTNFDRGFEFAASEGMTIDSAPKLSLPKLGVWNGVIHLHGIINDKDPDGRSLVLTSADFGSAYLTERWASRFISELFRRFTVLFVGYSIEDPVIRYMMDAFAADRALGEGVGPGYVLVGSTEAKRRENMDAWEAKGVIPILYDEAENHRALHSTLSKWAECHKNGLLGKESIIRDYGSKRPVKPFDDDAEVSQVLWAISETTGHAAHVFARLDPIPPLQWLEVFAERRLPEMHVSSGENGLQASLVDTGYQTSNPNPLHPVARELAHWLARHLDSPTLLDWVLHSGSSLHPDFQHEVRRRLNERTPLPAGLSPIWRLLTSEPKMTWTHGNHYYSLFDQLSTGVWNLHVKHELLAALTPELVFEPSLLKRFHPEAPVDETRIAQYAEAEVVLRWRDHGKLIRQRIQQSPNPQLTLANLPDDLTGLLKRAMEMLEIVQKADSLQDTSYSDQPSISPHGQNRGFREWTVLIDLLRDAWKQLLAVDRDLARSLVERWRTIRYPIFRRFCFYAMAETDLYSPSQSLAHLLDDGGWWLWSIHTYREQFRLLNSLWLRLSDEDAISLCSAIMEGPPRTMFREDVLEERYRLTADHSIWLHLAKLQSWGRELPTAASEVLHELSDKYREWWLAEGDRDEFLMWMEGGFGEPRVEDEDEFLDASDEIVAARLIAPSPSRHNELRKWQRVIEVQPSRASRLLGAVSDRGNWPHDVWETALQGFSAAKLNTKEWPQFIRGLLAAPRSLFEDSVRQIASLLRDVSSSLEPELDTQFWEAWDRTRPFAFQGEDGELAKEPITRAINIPAGVLTEALLDRVASKRPRSVDNISEATWARLSAIADGTTPAHTYARVVVASRLTWLHVLNAELIEQHFLKYLDWDHSEEASAVWQGYLWQARLTPELWRAVKGSFLAALRNKHKLGAFEEQIASLFGYICIDHSDWLSTEEMQSELRSLDADGRAAVARVIFHRLEGAGEQGETLWKTSISIWFDTVWPKDRASVHPDSAFNLAMATTYTGAAFESAVNLVEPFLIGSDNYSNLVERLGETNYPEVSPAPVLRLLVVVDTNYAWPDPNLRAMLTRLQAAQTGLANDPKFRRLDEYLRRNNL